MVVIKLLFILVVVKHLIALAFYTVYYKEIYDMVLMAIMEDKLYKKDGELHVNLTKEDRDFIAKVTRKAIFISIFRFKNIFLDLAEWFKGGCSL